MVAAVDSSGNGNDGTYTGVFGNPGRAGLVTGDAAAMFSSINGVANVLTPPSLLDFTTPFTIACLRANPTHASTVDAYLAITDQSTTPGVYLEFSIRDGPGEHLIVTTGFQEWHSDDDAVPDDGLAHLVAFTFDPTLFPSSTGGVFYVDGVVIPNAVEPVFAVPGIPMVEAGINGSVANGAAGESIFDEWASWNRALSGGEIASLQGARGSFAVYNSAVLALSPTAYYHLDEFSPGGWYVGQIAMMGA